MSIAARALHGMNVCIIPLPDNDDRPLLLRPLPLKIIAALLMAAKLAAVSLVALSPTYAELSTITSDRIVQLTNAERVKVGLPALTTNSQLAAAAKDKAAHMLAEDYFAHISPTGVTPWFWMSKHGYAYKVAGENLAIDFVEAENVVSAWLASPSHKDNMLHPAYTETGVAAVTGEFQGTTSTVVVHMFGLPPEGQVAAEASTETAEPQPETLTTPSTPTPLPPTPVASPVIVTPTPPALPRPPRIALVTPTTTVSKALALTMEGEANAEVTLAINDAFVTTVSLNETGHAKTQVDLSGYSDGQLQVVAVTRIAGQQSEPVILMVTKDTTGPGFGSEELSFLVAPLFDRGQAYVQWPTVETVARWEVNGHNTTDNGTVITLDEALEITAVDAQDNATVIGDITLAPQFETREGESDLPASRRAVQLSNRFIGTILTMIISMLCLTIIVRIHVQRPRLLGHATVVVFLAGVLLWL